MTHQLCMHNLLSAWKGMSLKLAQSLIADSVSVSC